MLPLSFNTAFTRTMGHEGTYSNHPRDKGGETVWGIARFYHGSWEGWKRVDSLREFAADEETFKSILAEDKEIPAMVRSFYRHTFWDKVKGDHLQTQDVANELFDTAVNCGKGTASRFLQIVLNKLNRNGDTYADIAVDGGIGGKTIAALTACLGAGDEEILLVMLNGLQMAYYIEHSNEDFIRGLINKRVRG